MASLRFVRLDFSFVLRKDCLNMLRMMKIRIRNNMISLQMRKSGFTGSL